MCSGSKKGASGARCTVAILPQRNLDRLMAELEKKYELKENALLGPGPNDGKDCKILNHISHWTKDGMSYEADPRQAEKLVGEFRLEGCRAVSTLGPEPTPQQVADDKPLPVSQATPFRAVTA